MVRNSKNGSAVPSPDELSFWEPHGADPRPNREVIRLARQCLDILKEKALAPTGVVSPSQHCSPGGIWMYFWDGSNYADLEFSNDGCVTLCFNLKRGEDEEENEDLAKENEDLGNRWEAKGPKRLVEGYAVEPDESGLRSAVRKILEHVDRRKTLKRY